MTVIDHTPGTQREPTAPGAAGAAWHAVTGDEACAQLGVDARSGLDPSEVGRRRAQVGPNKLAEAERSPDGGHSCVGTAT